MPELLADAVLTTGRPMAISLGSLVPIEKADAPSRVGRILYSSPAAVPLRSISKPSTVMLPVAISVTPSGRVIA